jgi:hypothetical protein
VKSSEQQSSRETPPEPSRLINALRHLGYDFETAVADLIDNSVAAGASRVLVRFVCKDDAVRSVIIADDGSGVAPDELIAAMTFGSPKRQSAQSLGKYGLGLKLASLGNARCVSLVSRCAGRSAGARWTVGGIESGWKLQLLTDRDARQQLDSPWGELDLTHSGTLVIWDDVDRMGGLSGDLRSRLRLIARRLELHLGLCFHRFLEAGRLTIEMDQQTEGAYERSVRVPVQPLNPFKYPETGHPNFPMVFKGAAPGWKLSLRAHIWPPNSDLLQYKLGSRAAARQGFYFYRNNRLLQAGGWNGVLQHETEPHNSLARISIELPTDYDSIFGLNVQKSAVIVPSAFDTAIATATTQDGTTFDAYRRVAQQVYRKEDGRARKHRPLVPVTGLPKSVQKVARRYFARDEKLVRKAGFKWRRLRPDAVFSINRHDKVIELNSIYREQLRTNGGIGLTSEALVKVLIYMLASRYLDSERVSDQQERQLSALNDLLLASAGVT